MLPADLVAVLACPRSKQPVIYFPRGETGEPDDAPFLLCVASRLRYRIDDGVPVMLSEEAESIPDETVNHLIDRARALGLPVPT